MYDFTVQSMDGSPYDIRELSIPLMELIDVKLGLFYTSMFKIEDVEKVKGYFENLGFTIVFIDERRRDQVGLMNLELDYDKSKLENTKFSEYWNNGIS